MKKFIAFLTVVALFAFTACDDGTVGNDGSEFTITATNVSNVFALDDDVVRVDARWWPQDAERPEESIVVATAEYIDHGFTLKLPALADNMLQSLPKNGVMIVSDPTARVGGIGIAGFNAAGEFLYTFAYMSDDEPYYTVYATYMYADKDVNITGTYEYEGHNETYNVLLKKGWNVVYEYISEDGDYFLTTTCPAGYAMEWYYGSKSSLIEVMMPNRTDI